MKQIINSILDTDLYKLTMQNWVIQNYQNEDVEYTFFNRDDKKFNQDFVNELKNQINLISSLRLKDDEYNWMKNNLYFLPISYLQYLSAYRYNPNQIKIKLIDNNLSINIIGKWRDTILWEVPLMAIISELYFKIIDNDWGMLNQDKNAYNKAYILSLNNCNFTDFGTRRRRNFETQNIVIKEMSKFPNFIGTSNPYFAMKYNIKALGTCAHEAIGAIASLESLNRPNKNFMESWTKTYNGDLGIMLPDTFGVDSFFNDFSLEKAKLWDGVRHDSGDWKIFTDKIINHYKKLKIDPLTKTIIFSDGLDVDTTIKIQQYCKDKIKCSFGIGTNFCSDFNKKSDNTKKSKAMNIVIKLTKINNIPVVKLSDSPGKAIGDKKMVEIMKYIHFKK